MQHSYKVNICGENLQIKSDQPPQVIERIAGYLDFKVKEIGKGTMGADKFRLMVLAGLNVSGELFELQAKVEEYDKRSRELEDKVRLLSESLDKAIRVV